MTSGSDTYPLRSNMLPWRARELLFAVILSQVLLSAACRKRPSTPLRSTTSAKPPPLRIVHPAAPGSFVKLVSRLKPSVVHLSTTVPVRNGPAQWIGMDQQPTDALDDPNAERLLHSLGSGFLIDRAGHLLTSARLIRQHSEILATLSNGSRAKAHLVGQDTDSDVALLKLALDSTDKLKPIRLGDSEQLKIGEWVLAVGNPFGLGPSVSAGVISSGPQRRNLPPGQQSLWGQIQTDARITPATVGGPLVNMLGEVVGICTTTETEVQGISFAIPINLAQKILGMLKREGKVVRAWLGIYGAPVTQKHARQSGLDKPKGALITSLVPGGPADRTGLRAGDIVLSFDKKPIHSPGELPWLASIAGINRQVAVQVWRNRKVLSFTIKIEPMPE